MTIDPKLIDALQGLRQDLPDLRRVLHLDLSDAWREWIHALDVKLLPRLQPDFPLVVAICGGGSAGKSTLFNSLINHQVSPTGGRAGLNRRVLAAVHTHHADNALFFDALAHTLGGPLQPMTDADQLTVPGEPVYCTQDHLIERVVLLDTPDIDTGAKGTYANRELARQSLEAADAFIYVFTNATYNNRDNTDFIAHLLTGLGERPCFLVYRVYPSFSDAEVQEHALTVATNLYGPDYKRHVLGIFRVDEDNQVAAGGRPMTVRAVGGGGVQALTAALASIDVQSLRQTLLKSMLTDAAVQARQMATTLRHAFDQLGAYLAALENAQRFSVQQALSHFPTDQVVRRFADIWLTTDPTHIKVMRRTGRVVEWPLKFVLSIVRGQRREPATAAATPGADDPAGLLELDLLQAANGLYQKTVAEHIEGEQGTVVAPPAVRQAQTSTRGKDWQAVFNHIKNQREMLLSWSSDLEKDLKTLAVDLRGRMALVDQIRQTFAAMLNVIPATAAITYILHTGDPVGAAGVKVKLTGLLGLHDLYALIAIPATAGMKQADQRQLEQMLAPLARTWLAHKLSFVQELFETHITAEVLHSARAIQSEAEQVMARMAPHLTALGDPAATDRRRGNLSDD